MCSRPFILTDPDLVPFALPTRPSQRLSVLRTFGRNFIETFPRSVYEQGVARIKTPVSDFFFVCDPNLIHKMLVERADTFRTDARSLWLGVGEMLHNLVITHGRVSLEKRSDQLSLLANTEFVRRHATSRR
jgi:hypothetical protein